MEYDLGDTMVIVEQHQVGASVLRMTDHAKNPVCIPNGFTLVNTARHPPVSVEPEDEQYTMVLNNTWTAQANKYELNFKGQTLLTFERTNEVTTYRNRGG
jgi:hypothetical protein